MSDRFDLKGATPESWACIDCGINTAPGMPSRIEMERRYNTAAAMQKLTRAEPSSITAWTCTFNESSEVYMVRDSVWKAAGLEPMGGCICIGCLEKRLGRKLNPKDFPRRHPLNSLCLEPSGSSSGGTSTTRRRRDDVAYPHPRNDRCRDS
jgi:hypothetical protein